MLPHYRKILYATDLSENARAAFRHAVSFARTYQAKIHLLHVMPQLLFDKRERGLTSLGYASTVFGADIDAHKVDEATADIVQKIHNRIKAFAEEELGEEAEALDWFGGTEVIVGKSPTIEILKAADRLDVDLMVLGSHSKGRVKQTLLGSVAEALVDELKRPVLVVPII